MPAAEQDAIARILSLELSSLEVIKPAVSFKEGELAPGAGDLNEVFGIWKNKKTSLNSVREVQWGRKR